MTLWESDKKRRGHLPIYQYWLRKIHDTESLLLRKFLIYQKRKLTEEPRGIILFLQKILQIIYCVLYVQALRRKQMQELNG